jgi:hypothetical protein
MKQRRLRKLGDGLGPIQDGDVLRCSLGDSKMPPHLEKTLRSYVDRATRMAISDGSDQFDPFALNKPGYRTYRDARARADYNETRELNRADALTDADNDFANTSPSWASTPPTGQVSHDLPKGPREGQSCTLNGYPGVYKRVQAPATFRPGRESRMVCVPVGRSADSLSAYDLYDLEVSDAWRTPATVFGKTSGTDSGTWNKDDDETETEDDETMNLPRRRKPEEADDDETDDDDAQDSFMEGAVEQAVYGTSTHTESQLRGDALRLDTLGKLRQHNTNMEKVYDAYDKQLAEAYRK